MPTMQGQKSVETTLRFSISKKKTAVRLLTMQLQKIVETTVRFPTRAKN